MKSITEFNREELQQKIAELAELRGILADVNAAIQQLEEEIKFTLDDHGIESIESNGIKVKYTTFETARFDSAAFKADHAELYEQYMKPTTQRRFTIN